MKNKILVGISLIIICCLICIEVKAADSSLAISGADSGKTGETNTLVVNLTSNESIGVISGMVTKSAGLSNISLEAQNSWQLLAYNEANGKFKLVKAEGGKNENVLSIKYTIGESKSDEKIDITGIEFTTLEYASISANDTSKKITISNLAQNNESNTIINTTNTTTNTTNNTTVNNTVSTNTTTNTNDNNSTKNNNNEKTTNTSGVTESSKNTSVQTISAKSDGSTTEKKLPKTGTKRSFKIISIIFFIVLAIGFKIKSDNLLK